MTGDGQQIIISGRRGDWPGGARTLTPRNPSREPNGRTLWFGVELKPDGKQVWFRVTSEGIRRMRSSRPAPDENAPGHLTQGRAAAT